MNKDLLNKHIKDFVLHSKENPDKFNEDFKERLDLVSYYQQFSSSKISSMTEEDVYEYLSKLWAMLFWGNKHYVVDKIIENNGLENLKKNLSELVWGKKDIQDRWDEFRSKVKGMGPAMISEILSKTHPDDFMLWNRRAYVGLNYLEVDNLPRFDYQLNGKLYKYLCDICKEIAIELSNSGFKDSSLLAVAYFIWDELQFEDNLSKIHAKKSDDKKDSKLLEDKDFIHNEIRDKIRDIGQWLGFNAAIEKKVFAGSRVDTVWEATIGNMGRIIYVFEVQTKGSIDGLILNLLKSLNNPAVQAVVAVSDGKQLETIKKHAMHVKDLRDKLKYCDYDIILRIHDQLAFVYESINNLGLIPQDSFL